MNCCHGLPTGERGSGAAEQASFYLSLPPPTGGGTRGPREGYSPTRVFPDPEWVAGCQLEFPPVAHKAARRGAYRTGTSPPASSRSSTSAPTSTPGPPRCVCNRWMDGVLLGVHPPSLLISDSSPSGATNLGTFFSGIKLAALKFQMHIAFFWLNS